MDDPQSGGEGILMKSDFDQTANFGRLKGLLKKYERNLTPRSRYDGEYHLWSVKDIEVAGRKRSEIYFAGIILQKGYVGRSWRCWMGDMSYTDAKGGCDFFETDVVKYQSAP